MKILDMKINLNLLKAQKQILLRVMQLMRDDPGSTPLDIEMMDGVVSLLDCILDASDSPPVPRPDISKLN